MDFNVFWCQVSMFINSLFIVGVFITYKHWWYRIYLKVAWSFVFGVMSLFVLSFSHYMACPSLIYSGYPLAIRYQRDNQSKSEKDRPLDTKGIIRVNQRRTACPSLIYSDYPFGILWPVLLWFTLNIPMVSYGLSFIDLLWLSLWYRMACPSLIYSYYPFGILCSVLLWFTLIIPLVSYEGYSE
jgi:predicted neutral ceramidase superfamily lipid hydrolase